MARRVLAITSVKRLESLSARQRETYTRARQARQLMLRAGMSRGRAAREAGTTPRTMERYLGPTVEKQGRRWRAKPGGRLYSYVWVPTSSGMRRLVATEREANLARAYKDALWRYVTQNDDAELSKFEGASIAGYTLETDPALIEEMIDRGELDPYEVGSGETGR
jgi:hypothetical protein